MRVNFISTAVPLRAGKRLKRQLGIAEGAALECTAFVLGYDSWHELNTELRKQPVSALDEQLAPEALQERRAYQLQRFTDFWASHPAPAKWDTDEVLSVWQPSAARPQEPAKGTRQAPQPSDTDLLGLCILWHKVDELPPILEDQLVEGLHHGASEKVVDLARTLAAESLANKKLKLFKLSRRVLEVLAPRNEPTVWFNLAMALLQGDGGPADPTRAAALLQRVSEAPNTEPHIRAWALTCLGTLQAKGTGRPLDEKKALAQWESAAAQGNIEAAFNAALTLTKPELEGKSVSDEDLKKGIRLYRQAAAGGHVHAMTNLGILLTSNPELATSMLEPQEHLERASQLGDANATQFLAELDRFADALFARMERGDVPESEIRQVQSDIASWATTGKPPTFPKRSR